MAKRSYYKIHKRHSTDSTDENFPEQKLFNTNDEQSFLLNIILLIHKISLFVQSRYVMVHYHHMKFSQWAFYCVRIMFTHNNAGKHFHRYKNKRYINNDWRDLHSPTDLLLYIFINKRDRHALIMTSRAYLIYAKFKGTLFLFVTYTLSHHENKKHFESKNQKN